MAIIAEWVTSSGNRIRVDDACMCAPGSAEERRAIENQRRIAYEILVREAEREAGNDLKGNP